MTMARGAAGEPDPFRPLVERFLINVSISSLVELQFLSLVPGVGCQVTKTLYLNTASLQAVQAQT